MATINVTLPSDGETIDAADYNTPITTIVNEINGNLDNSNIDASAAIAGSKLADGAITTAKIDDGAVTPAKLGRTVAGGIGTTINATGNYVVTGLGFEPRVIEVWAGILSNGSNASYSHGVYDRTAGTQGVIFSTVQSGNFGSGSLTTHVLRVDAPLNTILARASITATSSDGFTLNVDTYSAANSAWRWVAHA